MLDCPRHADHEDANQAIQQRDWRDRGTKMAVTLTGDNNYTGIYDDLWVLGGANNGGHDDTDNGSTNVFLFGNLQYKNTTVTDTSNDGTGTLVSSSTYQTTATGTSADTLHFTFNVSEGEHFTWDAWGGLSGSNAAYNGVESSYESWLASLPAGYTLSDPVSGVFNDPPGDPATFNGFDTADVAGSGISAAFGGAKTLLGFSVGSDHIALDGVTGESTFDANFTVTSTTHISSNGNTVHDTTIMLNGGSWSVDLYGVDTTSLSGDSQALKDFAWNSVIQHA
jgi:hypothetical protein